MIRLGTAVADLYGCGPNPVHGFRVLFRWPLHTDRPVCPVCGRIP